MVPWLINWSYYVCTYICSADTSCTPTTRYWGTYMCGGVGDGILPYPLTYGTYIELAGVLYGVANKQRHAPIHTGNTPSTSQLTVVNNAPSDTITLSHQTSMRNISGRKSLLEGMILFIRIISYVYIIIVHSDLRCWTSCSCAAAGICGLL